MSSPNGENSREILKFQFRVKLAESDSESEESDQQFRFAVYNRDTRAEWADPQIGTDMTNPTNTTETTTETPVHTGRPVKVWGVKITPKEGVEVKVGDTVGVTTK